MKIIYAINGKQYVPEINFNPEFLRDLKCTIPVEIKGWGFLWEIFSFPLIFILFFLKKK